MTSKAGVIAAITNVYAEVRAAAAADLAALPAVHTKQTADAQAVVDAAQTALTQAQAAFAALPVSQAADTQAATAKVASIDAEVADIIATLTKDLPDDVEDAPAAPVAA
jgi:hypothetical protein